MLEKNREIYGKMLWTIRKFWKKLRISKRNNKKVLEKI